MAPWKTEPDGKGGWLIKRSDTGKVVGHSKSKKKAQASIRARYLSIEGKE